MYRKIAALQWIISWYGAGKTSTNSSFNIPGKIAWITMEVPGFMTVLYIVNTLPAELGISDLPWQNKAMAGLFTIHYINRAILGPLLAPSMSPIHPLVWIAALAFQLTNGLSIGGYLGGYGPTASSSWHLAHSRIGLGLLVWTLGLAGNIYHDEVLRQIRRPSQSNKKNPNVHKVYKIPTGGLFKYVLYPHYLCEWIEWLGFWIIGGWACVPARNFVVNEVATMLPRAHAQDEGPLELLKR
ncbi:putative steroid 5 alpha-reductase [Venustampulla echinocandica]|uniref:Putative steroid 5 alpha-reductase n=1 Tax=Venustampulla echinocandica TaxID=2656787 RepID=A0A370TQH3_9HELO|nr:putative steroid 5 alpha-reductase [Venustampulla echinocandica]RDL37768.1 putative steroid 5 alpha-reductase [Venustampulla echinocandica]